MEISTSNKEGFDLHTLVLSLVELNGAFDINRNIKHSTTDLDAKLAYISVPLSASQRHAI